MWKVKGQEEIWAILREGLQAEWSGPGRHETLSRGGSVG